MPPKQATLIHELKVERDMTGKEKLCYAEKVKANFFLYELKTSQEISHSN